MRVIFKYNLGFTPRQDSILIPKGALILAVQAQKNEVVLWADVDPHDEPEEFYFRLVMTGEPVPNGIYLGTTQFDHGAFVMHVYRLAKEPTTH